jgi:hypothetical protein
MWEQTVIISLYSINWLVFITDTECAHCAVWAESTTALPLGKRPGTHRKGGWVGSRAQLDGRKILAFTEVRSPDLPILTYMLLLPEGQWGKALEPTNDGMFFRTSEEHRIEKYCLDDI